MVILWKNQLTSPTYRPLAFLFDLNLICNQEESSRRRHQTGRSRESAAERRESHLERWENCPNGKENREPHHNPKKGYARKAKQSQKVMWKWSNSQSKRQLRSEKQRPALRRRECCKCAVTLCKRVCMRVCVCLLLRTCGLKKKKKRGERKLRSQTAHKARNKLSEITEKQWKRERKPGRWALNRGIEREGERKESWWK